MGSRKLGKLVWFRHPHSGRNNKGKNISPVIAEGREAMEDSGLCYQQRFFPYLRLPSSRMSTACFKISVKNLQVQVFHSTCPGQADLQDCDRIVGRPPDGKG